jgi:predicted DNA-binding transcriptional regulator AlpA
MTRHETPPNDIPTKAMLTSSEVMALLRINRATLCRYCRSSIIPHPHTRMPDASYRFDPNAIQTWIAQRTVGGSK